MSALKYLFLALVVSTPALAQPPLVAYDISPPDYQCVGGPRNCYIPNVGSWGPVNPIVGGPSVTHAYIQFTLLAPQWVEITFDALMFLSPNVSHTEGGEYTPGIGIDGYDAAHVCNQYQGGLANDNTATHLSLPGRAICLIQLPAGAHTIYAMEYVARLTTYAFRGAVNQALIVRFH